MAPLAPFKSAHITLAIQPNLRDCEPLLKAAETHLAFSLDPLQSTSTQIESIQHCRRSALTTSRLLGAHLDQLTHFYDDWVAVIRKFTPRDDPDQVLAEQQAFQQMNEAPDGLRSMLNQLRITIQKLEFLDQDLGEMLARLGTTPCTTPPLGLNPSDSSQTQQSTAHPNNANSPSPSNGDASSNVHLPKLQLRIFDGKPYEWFEFWELFEATVDRSSLSDVEKLAYLISCLRGKAKDVAAGYTRRGDNYQPLVTALRTQFGNKDALSRQLQLDLRTIRPPSHNGPDLLRFYNDASRIIHHMQIADIDPEQHQKLSQLSWPQSPIDAFEYLIILPEPGS
uniref:Retrotransposon gag domain-containing protein n=1 Tax=Ascaris lumbricoides TaxID=6252 RepID=A0A0M3HNZ5_ASCLU